MANSVKAANTAKKLVEKNGRTVQLFKYNRTPDDPAKPWLGTSSAPTASQGGEQVSAKVAFVPATGSGFGKMLRDKEGELDVAFDQIGLLASDSLPDGTNAEEFDSVRDGSDIWKVVTRGHLRPGDKSILFVLGLKR